MQVNSKIYLLNKIKLIKVEQKKTNKSGTK